MIKIGTSDISNVYIGSTPVKEIYIGSVKYWPTDSLYIENNTSTAGTVTLTLYGSGVSVKLSTSVDNKNWTTETTYSATSTFILPASGKLYLKGSNTQFNTSTSNFYNISVNVKHNIGGNIMSLCNYKTTLSSYEFYNLFYGDKNLVSAENLILPITTLAQQCYYCMFYGCTSLTSAPALPATTLANYCYQSLFDGCTSLTTAPALPATTLAIYCYSYMFYGCTSLTSAPALPATTLTNYCYQNMFISCTSLTSAPVLPATTLVTRCYYYMFYGCTKLNYIKALFTTTPSTTYTTNWVTNVASSGTFIKSVDATWDVTGVNGVPTGWTVQTATS